MCGIAGFSGSAVRGRRRRARCSRRMIHTLHHRGPDGYGFHAAAGIGLAHARLSIIDLATGDQPIHNERARRLDRVQRRDLQLRRAARDARSAGPPLLHAVGHRGHRAPVRPLRRSRSSITSTASSRSRCGTRAASGWCSRATAPASARCSTRRRADGIWFASEIKALLAVLPECATLDPQGLVAGA